ncbi:MAG: ADP-ribosylglycohydrolase family protein, partial [Planctomycetes bacterium]|nr:ADP-ribosylglycohydrolase family protein [Planctomycetota bacterium]
MIADYEKKVYAAVLGKVLGVYAGRPFEGWPKERLAERFGVVDRYVNEDLGCPDVVVVDDDVSGTLTFVRALADSGAYAATSPAAFGECWLNYLLENQTVLWWGGFGRSTEHTAFLRLKSGVPAPRSGSMALNGRTVSEQIGAQIFIDAFGMVAPGRPEEAARLAKMAAQVSHDGEAVYAAQVVAAMVSVAFVESDMEKILDRGVACVPADCLIARLHREVRAWAREDGDWQRTYERIAAKYGYDKFGGCCHVVPNHALMVMAWAYAGADFHRAMQIVNTAGWDTDCNAGNVGCVCALAAGLEHLADGYDYDAPVAGRVVIGAAEGSMTTADVLRQAQMIARIGRRVMGWPDAPAPKGGAWMHFSQPGARQGWLPDESAGFPARGNAATANPDGAGL